MSDSLFDLSGKLALVTGSSRGIGAATAQLLAAHGAEVILSSRKADGLQAVAETIISGGGKAHVMPCHTGEGAAIEAMMNDIEARFGRLDILVNNAATNPYFGHILDTDLSALDKTVAVNLRGYFHLAMRAGQLMRKQGGGAIVNVSSVNGVTPAPFQGAYSVTKAAVISMTQAFAKECAGLNIRVNAVLPGLTDTKFASVLIKNEDILNTVLPQIPMGRVARPEEIAPAILFLVSPASSYVTGAILAADGGYLS
jgi:NAD(P)-dependent dehydrogenase (short-subunit alcohol dehydrogenase family)